jgi:O-antigen/teichoic acid export membrane protein
VTAPSPAPAPESRRDHLAFFRQSGWMLLANALAGLFFTLANNPAGQIANAPGVGKAEFATFGALLDSLILLGIPAAGLQAVFAQLASGAVDTDRQRQLRATIRTVLLVVVAAWAAVACGAWIGRSRLLSTFQIANPWALAFTLGTVLIGLVYPVFAGLLQGGQKFLWLGNAAITSGAGRLAGVTLAVVVLGHLAAGAMAGVMLGSLAALTITIVSSRSTWWGPSVASRDWSWVRPCLALTLGLAAGNVMLAADSTFVQSAFTGQERAFYVAAGKVGRALVFLTMPLALVLFPRVAKSAATGQPTAALQLALGATLGTGLAAALFGSAFPKLTIQVLYFGNPVFLPAAELVPLFCWCMLPLTAAYTLVNNILARRRFAAVPWLLLVATGYAVSLAAMREGVLRRASPLLEASEVRPSLGDRLKAPTTALDLHLHAAITQAGGSSPTPPFPDSPERLAEAINQVLTRETLYDTQRFAGILLGSETQSRMAEPPDGANLGWINRRLLEDAYPGDLERRPARRLFDESRRVLRTLGFFSLLLLGVSVLFSLPRAAGAKAGRPA